MQQNIPSGILMLNGGEVGKWHKCVMKSFIQFVAELILMHRKFQLWSYQQLIYAALSFIVLYYHLELKRECSTVIETIFSFQS